MSKFHHIGTDISTKLGTVAIGIRTGIRIGIGVGSVETVLHIIIGSISIEIGLGIGVGQCEHTIMAYLFPVSDWIRPWTQISVVYIYYGKGI